MGWLTLRLPFDKLRVAQGTRDYPPRFSRCGYFVGVPLRENPASIVELHSAFSGKVRPRTSFNKKSPHFAEISYWGPLSEEVRKIEKGKSRFVIAKTKAEKTPFKPMSKICANSPSGSCHRFCIRTVAKTVPAHQETTPRRRHGFCSFTVAVGPRAGTGAAGPILPRTPGSAQRL